MFIYYVYILKCSDHSYYTGITNDMDKRFVEHKSGKYPDCYTFHKRPLELKYYETFNDVYKQFILKRRSKNGQELKKKL